MHNWRAVVFDLDDTLYPEREYVLSGFRAVAAWGEEQLRIPRAEGERELADLFAAGVRGDTFNRWLALHNQSAALVPELVTVYRRHRPALSPFPGVPALLTWVRQRFALGLLSDGYLDVQRRKFAALGLAPYFDALVFSDEWGREAWKPSAHPFTVVAGRLAIAASDTVYIGDNPNKDFLGARGAGMQTIWLRHHDGEYARLAPPTENHAADIVVDSLAALRVILRQSLPARPRR